jgi:hypothetical protein
MTTTASASSRATTSSGDLAALGRSQGRRRLLPTVALGVFALAASFVVFLALEPKPAGHPVLVLRADVVAGQPLTTDDLRVVTLDSSGLSTISAKDEATVVGKALSVSLPTGSLISENLLVGASGPLPGQAIVGAALKPGAFPPDLAPGAQVQLYAGAANPLGSATVFSVQDAGDAQTETVVSLMLSAKLGGTVSAAATAGTLTLVWVTP